MQIENKLFKKIGYPCIVIKVNWNYFHFSVLKQVSEWNLQLMTCNYIDFHFPSWVFFKVTMLKANGTWSTAALRHPNCSRQLHHENGRWKALPTVRAGQPSHLPPSPQDLVQCLTLVKGEKKDMLMGWWWTTQDPGKIEGADNLSNKRCSSGRCIVYREYIKKWRSLKYGYLSEWLFEICSHGEDLIIDHTWHVNKLMSRGN